MTETEPAADLPEFAPPPPPNEALILELDGFEGPLDLLLALARHQKVDIAKISVLQLADQYLAFIEQAGRRKLELAADYLVMAAWLTFLKSRLVLPQPADAIALALGAAQRHARGGRKTDGAQSSRSRYLCPWRT
jgi:segregation and condensation protein A